MSAEHDLEKIIDKVGLNVVLDHLSRICQMKSDHIMASYSDKNTADWWQNAAYWCQEANDRIHEEVPDENPTV